MERSTRLMIVSSCLAVAFGAPSPLMIAVPGTDGSSPTLLSSHISLSVEFSSFPTFAGTESSPNKLSVNLLSAISSAQGAMPVIRVGGNSQDRAIYDPSLDSATQGSGSSLKIGKSFFDSYHALPDTTYSHGFNIASDENLLDGVSEACKALGDRLEVWEYGNEPDLLRGKMEPTSWSADDYTEKWRAGTERIVSQVKQSCPELESAFSFMAPSLSHPDPPSFSLTEIGQSGFFNHSVGQLSMHNYITGGKSSYSLSDLSHSKTMDSISRHVQLAASFPQYDYVLGEQNSIYSGGARGISNSFGAALWSLDFACASASTGVIKRIHYHQAFDAAYSAWTSSGSDVGTRPSFYGILAAATFLADSSKIVVKALTLSGDSDNESGYAAYEGGSLVRLAVLNLREYNSNSGSRPSQTYTFGVAPGSTWKLQRLTAPGSDDTQNASFNGYTYEHASLGVGVQQSKEASDVKVTAGADGGLKIQVLDSEAVIAILEK